MTNPDFFGSAGPVISTTPATPVVQEISSNLRAPYILQSALTLERQLPGRTTVAVTYSNSHGLHALRPLPPD